MYAHLYYVYLHISISICIYLCILGVWKRERERVNGFAQIVRFRFKLYLSSSSEEGAYHHQREDGGQGWRGGLPGYFVLGGQLASDGVRYAGARSSVGRQFRSVTNT